MKKRFLLGKFWNPDDTLSALGKLREEGVWIHDVYSPFPIHGIEPYLNIKRTRLTIAAFIYGCMGALTALLLMGSIYGFIWPMDIGGKPSLAWPDFVPITFELTVLFSAHGMVLTFLIVGQYWPGKKVQLMDERQCDDVFVVAIDKEKIAPEDEGRISQLMNEHGAFEISEKEV
ncbi:MAG: DUF3341 domain-containing protein [Bacteroidetes bacterium]|nr:MAG: DUF3341 domain-containing protein [Bacteroidota bacterium]